MEFTKRFFFLIVLIRYFAIASRHEYATASYKFNDTYNVDVRNNPKTSINATAEPSLTKLAIVTRSGFRPSCFNNLQASIAVQHNVEDIIQIVSNDAGKPGLYFLKAHASVARHKIKIVSLQRSKYWQKGRRDCSSSRYLNILYHHVPKGYWIMTLDDDSRLLNLQQLDQVRSAAASVDPSKQILLQDAFMWKQKSFKIYPNYTQSKIWIDTANVIFHQSAVRFLNYKSSCGGDKLGFSKLLHEGYRPMAISAKEPGVWANYRGPAHQKLVNCRLSNQPLALGARESEFLFSDRYNAARVEAAHWEHQAQTHQNHLRRMKYRMPN